MDAPEAGEGGRADDGRKDDPLYEERSGGKDGPRQGQDHGGQGQLPVHIAAPDEAPGGHRRAHAGGQLVGAQGQMGRQARQQMASYFGF